MDTPQAERILTLELGAALVTRMIWGFRKGKMLGPSAYVPLLIAYGLLSVGAQSRYTARISAGLGGLLLVTVLLVPTTDSDGTKSTVGKDAIQGLAGTGVYIASNPVATAAPPGTRGAKSSTVAPSSLNPSNGPSAGMFTPGRTAGTGQPLVGA